MEKLVKTHKCDNGTQYCCLKSTLLFFYFRSCSGRDHLGPYSSCDSSWLLNQRQPKNPLAVGQIVNNASHPDQVNILYQEIDIPYSFPSHLLQYIPNVRFNPFYLEDYEDLESVVFIRVVILVALREIQQGEELFSSYFTEVQIK